MRTQSERYVVRIKQVVALRKELAECQDVNKELNTEYQLLHQELEAVRQQMYNQLDKVEHLELINKELQTQRDNALRGMTKAQESNKQWKLLYGVLEDIYKVVKNQLDVANIILDLRRW